MRNKLARLSILAASILLAVPAHAYSTGDLIRGPVGPNEPTALYYVASDGKRYVFPNERVYFSWYGAYDFGTGPGRVNFVPVSDIASINIGGMVAYRPGVKMIKIQSDPRVYAVGRAGVLHWIKTEAIAAALYGSDWKFKVDDISDAFFVNYTTGAEINSASDFNPAAETSAVTSIDQNR